LFVKHRCNGTPNWIPPLLDHFNSNPATAILQPHILDYKVPNQFEYAGAAGGYLDANGVPFCRGRLFSTLEEDQGQYQETTQIFWASGACFFIRSQQFWELKDLMTTFLRIKKKLTYVGECTTMALTSWRLEKVKYFMLVAQPSKLPLEKFF
jgi:hypothetical protein